MKNLLIIISVAFSFVSCGDALNEYKCHESIKKAFPNSLSIVNYPNMNYHWIVVSEDSSIYFVETLNYTNAEISNATFIYKF